jgi:hypothetical protein
MRVTQRLGFLAGAFFLVVLSACVSTSFQPAKDYEARRPGTVSAAAIPILRSLPKQPYQTLGTIEAWISGFPSDETVRRRAREAAAAVGADAIIHNGRGDLFAEPSANEGELVSPRTVALTFTAIRYLNSARRSP